MLRSKLIIIFNDFSEERIKKMIEEMYRVLGPGSRLVTFSLHPVSEVVCKYDIPTRFQWKVTVIYIPL